MLAVATPPSSSVRRFDHIPGSRRSLHIVEKVLTVRGISVILKRSEEDLLAFIEIACSFILARRPKRLVTRT